MEEMAGKKTNERTVGMADDVRSELIRFRKIMKAGGGRERAASEKAYLKSPFRFFGTSLPFTDKVAKEFRKRHGEAGRNYVLSLAKKLFSSEYHDEKRLGLRLLQAYPRHLDLAVMPLLEEMLMKSPTWDLVDDISIHLVGTVLEKDAKAYRYLRKWGRSENFWMRRASLISPILLFRRGSGDTRLFYALARKMLGEKEFFIRKSIGWALREISKADPDGVFGFLMEIRGKASGLTLREGSKRLSGGRKSLVLGKK